VFGGITLIALVVVAYVMWERTKYRKNFRERKKLADLGAGPGYGGIGGQDGSGDRAMSLGMAQRV